MVTIRKKKTRGSRSVSQLYVDNLPHLGGLATTFYTLQSLVDTLASRFKHGLSTSIANVSHLPRACVRGASHLVLLPAGGRLRHVQ